MTTGLADAPHRPSDSALEARTEVRVLDPVTTVVTTPDGVHRTVGLGASDVLRLLDHWTRPGAGTVDEALVEAADPLRRILLDRGGLVQIAPTSAPPTVALPVDEGARGQLLLTGDDALVRALVRRAGAADVGVSTAPWDPRAVVNRAYRTGELLVVCVHGARDSDLVDLDRTCHDMRVPWVALELTRGEAWVGPFVTPGVGASFEDAVQRRAAAAFDRRVHRVVRTPSLTGDAGPAPHEADAVLSAALAVLGGDRAGDVLHRLRLGDPAEDDAVASTHPVLPMPGSPTTHRPHDVDDLVDPVSGLVLRTRDITHDASVPASLVTKQCDVADVRAVSPWANNVLCQGSSFGDPDGAAKAALGESVERYCGNILDTLPVTYGSHDELRRRGVPVLDPRELVLYSDAQYAAPGFPFVPLTRETRVHWVPGRSLTRDAEVLVPASLVYVNWYAAGYSSAPITNFCAFAGIAAGPDLDFAVMSGLEEVVERHATMVWWLNGHPLPRVPVPAALQRLWDGTDVTHQRSSLIALDDEFAIPVAAAVVHDDTDRIVNVGFSARPTFEAAAAKAWTEALTLQEGSRDLLRMDGLHWAVMASGELNGRAFKLWREDRRYLDDFRADMRDCDDLMVQQQVYLDPRAAERMAHLLEPAGERPLASLPTVPERSASAYRAAVEAAGREVIVVDLTTPDVASTGMAVVRVLVPGTVGNAPAAFPFLGGRRVQDLAVELGWRETALEEDELNYFPMPHA
ncbi:ribosomal protein S12 methylthiotransferase accessory factor [Aeromicrobium sp. SORGH_AS981]|uniref:YcaO-like family protein n=1 Tax=Aeromicrobium sp. SORGH_AS_0981 TaxID=3041802 RepID=UPI00285DFE90|nr:YcaO-like family protein [Aeromicrobium sp. SORGH_AS_0981]MDR6119704.1 ribosomal protein S12 methylthiotransferase accessory factor [Aeromicrobium sp. SORGH_AS_0981]